MGEKKSCIFKDEDIKKFEASLNELSEKCEEKDKHWNLKIQNLSARFKTKDGNEIVDYMADVLNEKQMILEDIRQVADKLSKCMKKKRELSEQISQIYSTTSQLKMTDSRLNKMVEAELSVHIRQINIYEIHIEHLRETAKNIEQINYHIKNRIDLMGILKI
jgi:DNA repair exonuclease SbcCD ATPase subunit